MRALKTRPLFFIMNPVGCSRAWLPISGSSWVTGEWTESSSRLSRTGPRASNHCLLLKGRSKHRLIAQGPSRDHYTVSYVHVYIYSKIHCNGPLRYHPHERRRDIITVPMQMEDTPLQASCVRQAEGAGVLSRGSSAALAADVPRVAPRRPPRAEPPRATPLFAVRPSLCGMSPCLGVTFSCRASTSLLGSDSRLRQSLTSA